MKDSRLTDSELELLSQLLKEDSVSIVWDINAFYFNTAKASYKLECFDDKPDGSGYEYDEIFFCKFLKLSKKEKFEVGNPKYWYKIIAKKAKIKALEVVEVVQKYPEARLVEENELEATAGINKVSLGLIITTTEGLVPAFLLPSNHGFSWPSKFDFYSFNEVNELLREEIKIYKIKTVPNNT
jgi:hypothetical protein